MNLFERLKSIAYDSEVLTDNIILCVVFLVASLWEYKHNLSRDDIYVS